MRINDCFVIREIYGKTLFMPVKTNDISNVPICANDEAQAIISVLPKSNTINDIIYNLSKEYDLSDINVCNDIKNFIQELISSGLIRR